MLVDSGKRRLNKHTGGRGVEGEVMKKSKTFKDFRTAYKAGHLLDLKMPNGLALRDCTAEDCLAYGDWLEGVGRRIRRGWDGDQVDHIPVCARLEMSDRYRFHSLRRPRLKFSDANDPRAGGQSKRSSRNLFHSNAPGLSI